MRHVQAIKHLLNVLGTRCGREVHVRRADLVDLTSELITAVLLDHGGCTDAVVAPNPGCGGASEPGPWLAAAKSGHALGVAAPGESPALEARPLLACALQAMGHLIPLLHAVPRFHCSEGFDFNSAVAALVALWRRTLSLPDLNARALPAAIADALAHVVGVACTGSVPGGALGAHSAAGRALARQLLHELLCALHADVLRAGQGLGFRDALAAPSAPLSPVQPGRGAVLVRLARAWAHLSLRASPAFVAEAAEQMAGITALLGPDVGCLTPIALSLGFASALRSAAGASGLEPSAADIGRLPGGVGRGSAAPPGSAAAALRLWAVAADALARALVDGRHATASKHAPEAWCCWNTIQGASLVKAVAKSRHRKEAGEV